jgi:acetyl esterase
LPNKLDPQAQSILDQLVEIEANKTDSDRALSAEEKINGGRTFINSILIQVGIAPESVFKVEDFHIPSATGNIPARIYNPRRGAPSPALIYYHGGGFVAGDLDCYDSLCRALANRAECIVVSVAYRLAPENPYPAAVDDAWAALQWVADHGSELGADPNRLAVGGDSAGGTLAAWVAQKASENGPALRLQVLFCPTLDAHMSSASWKELGTGAYLVKLDDMTEWYNAYLPAGTDRDNPKVSPLYATNLAGVAPALILTAEYDPLRDEGNLYAAKLQAANIAVDHTCWAGMIHDFPIFAGVIDAGKVFIDQTGTALRKAFGPPATQ